MFNSNSNQEEAPIECRIRAALAFVLAVSPALAQEAVPLKTYASITNDSQQQGAGMAWSHMEMPTNRWYPQVDDLAVERKSSQLYALSSNSLWTSDNRGDTWVRCSLMLRTNTSLFERQVFVDGADARRVYIAPELVRSDDGGHRWSRLSDLNPEQGDLLLGTDPVLAGRVYARFEERLAYSDDAGSTWEETQLSIPAEGAQVLVATKPHIIYVYVRNWVDDGTLMQTDDRGETWTIVGEALPFGHLSIAAVSGVLYGQDGDELLKSTDGGYTWRKVSTSPVEFRHLAIHPVTESLMYGAGMYGGVFCSRDGGATWSQMSETESLFEILPLVDRDVGGRAVALGEYGVYHTDDYGVNWHRADLATLQMPAGTVVFDEKGDMYVGSVFNRRDSGEASSLWSPGVVVSSDRGRSWNMVTRNSPQYFFSGLVDVLHFGEATGSLIAHYSARGTYLLSHDGAVTLTPSRLDGWKGPSFRPLYPGIGRLRNDLFVVDWTIRATANLLESWELRSAGLTLGGRVGGFVADGALGVLYSAIGATIWRSENAGRSWQATGEVERGPIEALALGAPDHLYAGTPNGVYPSKDAGRSWTGVLFPEEHAWSSVRLRVSPHNSDHLYLVGGEVLLVSQNGGETWTTISHQLTDSPWISDVAFDPESENVIYAATAWGLYRGEASASETDVRDTVQLRSRQAALNQNYPNPFNSSTIISYHLARPEVIRLVIYSVSGQRVRVLAEGSKVSGYHHVRWDGRANDGRTAASGVYICRLEAGDLVETRKLVVLR